MLTIPLFEFFNQRLMKSTFTVLLSFCFLISLIPLSSQAQFAGGDGSSGDPYQIATASQLNSVRNYKSAHFIQTADIDLDVAPYNTGTGWEPIGDNSAQFTGSYDGGGFTISGLFIDDNGQDYVGLFGSISSSASITKVGMLNADVVGRYHVGTLVGKNNGTVSECYATGVVEAVTYAGGLIGNNTGTLENSYVNAEISATSFYGGLAGNNEGSITNSYSVGLVNSGSSSGGLLGRDSGGSVSSSYWDTETSQIGTSAGGSGLTSLEMKKESSFSGWDFSSIWAIESGSTISYPYLRNNEQTPHLGKLSIPFAGGDGSSENPYHVANATQLDSVRNFKSAHFVQTADINLDVAPYNTGTGWEPIGNNSVPFLGSYDGSGFTISGLFIDENGLDYMGLFGSISSSASITKVGILNADVVGRYHVGALVGKNSGTVSECYATGVVEGATYAGGLVGNNTGTLKNSYANVDLEQGSTFGGLVGNNDTSGIIEYCYSFGEISTFGTTSGALIGNNKGSITNSYWNSSVTAISGVGQNTGTNTSSALTNSQMTDSDNFPNFDFENYWLIDDGYSFPILKNANQYITSVINIDGTEGWRMFSSPLSSTSYGTLFDTIWLQGFTGANSTNGTSNILTWNETSKGFQSINNSSDIAGEGTGFITYVFSDDGYDGTEDGFPKQIIKSGVQHMGTISPSISFTNSGTLVDDGWNLLGNPYGTTIDWDASNGWTRSNLDGVYYVWSDSANGGLGSYLSWNGATGTLPSGLIAPWQGFWVKANAESPSLSMNDSTKSSGGVFQKKAPVSLLKFGLENDGYNSNTIVMFDERAEVAKDGLDAYKLQSLNAEYLSLFTKLEGGSALDINALPKTIEVPISIPLDFASHDVSGEYTLSWNPSYLPEGMTLTLIDNETKTEINLNKASSYSFEIESEANEKAVKTQEIASPQHRVISPTVMKAKSTGSRFTIKVNSKTSVGNEQIADLPQSVELQQNYPNPFNPTTTISYQLPANGKVKLQVFDMLGRQVAELVNGQVEAGYHQITFDARNLASGMYIYRLQTGNSIITKKLTLIK